MTSSVPPSTPGPVSLHSSSTKDRLEARRSQPVDYGAKKNGHARTTWGWVPDQEVKSTTNDPWPPPPPRVTSAGPLLGPAGGVDRRASGSYGGPDSETNGSAPPPHFGFHKFFLRQIQISQEHHALDNLLQLELLSHLQSVMLEIAPQSRFRLHGSLVSRVQTRMSPLEICWDIEDDETDPADIDPLKRLAIVLRRQQPTPLKYLFKVQPLPAYNALQVQDLVSNTACEITVNNSWGVLFSEVVHRYCESHPVLTCAIRCISHWACLKGFILPPPLPKRLQGCSDQTGGAAASGAAGAASASDAKKKDQLLAAACKHVGHAGISLIAVLFLRYLLDRFQYPNVGEVLLGHPLNAARASASGLAVEDVLLGFFAFYRDVDFGTSTVCIRSPQDTPLQRGTHRSTTPTSSVDSTILRVNDPFTGRNLAGSWSQEDVRKIQYELQERPWAPSTMSAVLAASSASMDGPSAPPDPHSFEVYLKRNDQAISTWLLTLFDYHPGCEQTLQQRFEAILPPAPYYHSWDTTIAPGLSQKGTSLPVLLGDKPLAAFPTREELLTEVESFRVMQQTLAERIRFLRNDVWWLERHAGVPARRDNTAGVGQQRRSGIPGINAAAHVASSSAQTFRSTGTEERGLNHLPSGERGGGCVRRGSSGAMVDTGGTVEQSVGTLHPSSHVPTDTAETRPPFGGTSQGNAPSATSSAVLAMIQRLASALATTTPPQWGSDQTTTTTPPSQQPAPPHVALIALGQQLPLYASQRTGVCVQQRFPRGGGGGEGSFCWRLRLGSPIPTGLLVALDTDVCMGAAAAGLVITVTVKVRPGASSFVELAAGRARRQNGPDATMGYQQHARSSSSGHLILEDIMLRPVSAQGHQHALELQLYPKTGRAFLSSHGIELCAERDPPPRDQSFIPVFHVAEPQPTNTNSDVVVKELEIVLSGPREG